MKIRKFSIKYGEGNPEDPVIRWSEHRWTPSASLDAEFDFWLEDRWTILNQVLDQHEGRPGDDEVSKLGREREKSQTASAKKKGQQEVNKTSGGASAKKQTRKQAKANR